MEEILETIGQRLKDARNRADLTQPKLAELCGWDPVQGRISNYETDNREPTIGELKKMAEILKVDPAWLILGGHRDYQLHEPNAPSAHQYLLPKEAVDVATKWLKLIKFKQDIYRELIEHDAALAEAMPWYATVGRPEGEHYGNWDAHIKRLWEDAKKQLELPL
jgi:transcriptional regulator with XRE-family HTH domain